MATLAEIVSEKVDRLDDVPDSFTDRVGRTQKEIANGLLAQLNQLTTTSGSIDITEANLNAVNDILEELRGVLNRSEYVEAVRQFASEFDAQGALNNELFASTFDNFVEKDLFATVLSQGKRNAVEALIGNTGVDNALLNPVRAALNQAVASGAGVQETIGALRDVIEGNEERLGTLQRHAKQIASDAFSMTDRGYTETISEDLGVEFFRYIGGLVTDTRDFCTSRNNKFYHSKEIEDWVKPTGKPKPSGTWQGKMPNTTSKSIFIQLGGFNCRHSLIPQSVARVPEEVINRNIANGNYEAE